MALVISVSVTAVLVVASKWPFAKYILAMKSEMTPERLPGMFIKPMGKRELSNERCLLLGESGTHQVAGSRSFECDYKT